MRVELKYLADELLSEISGYCTLAANASESAGRKDTHDTRDVLEDGNLDIIRNIISRLLFETMNILFPFAKTPLRRHTPRDNKPADACTYIVALDFPHKRSETSVQQLKSNIQSYIVYKCVAEWLSLTMPDTGIWQTWEQKAQEQREQVSTALAMPMTPRRMKVKPHFY